jgi:hypothetical protein
MHMPFRRLALVWLLGLTALQAAALQEYKSSTAGQLAQLPLGPGHVNGLNTQTDITATASLPQATPTVTLAASVNGNARPSPLTDLVSKM